LDANIFFAAVYSPQGGSGRILELCKSGKVKPVAIPLVLLEADLNIRKKLSLDHLFLHYENISSIQIELVSVDREEAIRNYGKIISDKDVPILAGAIKCGAEVLISLDRHHFFTEKVKKANFNITIQTPGEFLKKYFSQE